MITKNKIIVMAANCFGLGNTSVAPGTFGTLAGIPIVLVLNLFRSKSIYFLFMVAFFFLSVYISDEAETLYGEKDAQNIVIDEVMGLIVTMFLIKINLFSIITGFLLFRFFDITKIPPINRMQNLKGGFGIVADDVMAGIFANFIMAIIFYS